MAVTLQTALRSPKFQRTILPLSEGEESTFFQISRHCFHNTQRYIPAHCFSKGIIRPAVTSKYPHSTRSKNNCPSLGKTVSQLFIQNYNESICKMWGLSLRSTLPILLSSDIYMYVYLPPLHL